MDVALPIVGGPAPVEGCAGPFTGGVVGAAGGASATVGRLMTCGIGARICGDCCTGGRVCIVVVVDVDPAACVLPTFRIWYCPFSVLTRRCPCCPVGMPWPGLSPCSVCSGTDSGVIPGWFMTMFLPEMPVDSARGWAGCPGPAILSMPGACCPGCRIMGDRCSTPAAGLLRTTACPAAMPAGSRCIAVAIEVTGRTWAGIVMGVIGGGRPCV